MTITLGRKKRKSNSASNDVVVTVATTVDAARKMPSYEELVKRLRQTETELVKTKDTLREAEAKTESLLNNNFAYGNERHIETEAHLEEKLSI